MSDIVIAAEDLSKRYLVGHQSVQRESYTSLRDVIARGVFTSVSDLNRKLLRYIRHYNKSPRTVKWKYADPSRHLSTQSVGTGH